MREKYWWLNEESEQVLNRGYLLKGETVEGAIDRIIEAACKRLFNKEEFSGAGSRRWRGNPLWRV